MAGRPLSEKRVAGGFSVVFFGPLVDFILAGRVIGPGVGDPGRSLILKSGMTERMVSREDMRKSQDPVAVAEKTVQTVQDRLKVLQASPAPENASTDWCRQDEIIGLLASVTDSMVSACRQRSTEYTAIVERMSTIEANIKDIREDVASLCRIVRDGNGQPSMTQRLANLETIVTSQQGNISKVEKHANAIIAAKALSKSQVVAGLIGMIVTALISSLALVATLLK